MSREELAARQAELLEALLSDGAAPSGFDAKRLRVEADVLRDKRRRLVAYLRPDLPEALGERFAPLFDAYATEHPKTTEVRTGQYADAFATWLISRGELAKPRRRWFQH
ncbi:hypothetical protein ATK36_0072 [Amycolatopsis sulphurea]|uniref:SCO6045-like C-terminal domain-containing protein n=1 Tax=Amycolatopsis sulphurea TaxID=76022 RepID=A0A2A9G076_9PSEU|nr:hypothetical protein [Amycolatopsis sulphurea]PFG56553.1 hypothetical protein ATK36_0072 [Amycolatopsis sulphurea]